jgi:hypothetical protein
MVRFSEDEKPWDWVRFQDGRVFPRGASTSSSVDFAQLWWDTWDRHNLQVCEHMLPGGIYLFY